MNTNRPTPRHTIIKTVRVKNKLRILKAAREKQKEREKKKGKTEVSYKGTQ